MRKDSSTAAAKGAPSHASMSDQRRVLIALVVVALVLAAAGLVLARIERGEAPASATSSSPRASATTRATASQDASAVSGTQGAYTLATLAEQHSEQQAAIALSAQVQSAIEQVASQYGTGVSVTYIPFASTDAIASVNGSTQRLSASMIKMLVLACLLDKVAAGEVDLSAQLAIQADELADGTGDIQSAGVGATYSVYELARAMISNSDNTAANMLIDLLGFDAINAEAAKLGLAHTTLANKLNTGGALNEGRNVTSSDDMARLFVAIATAQVGDEQLCSEALGFLTQQTLEGGIPLGVPDGITCAHKTGSIDGVENDGAIVYASYPYVLVVLTEGVDDGISVAEQISQAVYAVTNG